jgi:hypothetical protein
MPNDDPLLRSAVIAAASALLGDTRDDELG